MAESKFCHSERKRVEGEFSRSNIILNSHLCSLELLSLAFSGDWASTNNSVMSSECFGFRSAGGDHLRKGDFNVAVA